MLAPGGAGDLGDLAVEHVGLLLVEDDPQADFLNVDFLEQSGFKLCKNFLKNPAYGRH